MVDLPLLESEPSLDLNEPQRNRNLAAERWLGPAPSCAELTRLNGVPEGLTTKIRNGALRLLQCVYFGVCDE